MAQMRSLSPVSPSRSRVVVRGWWICPIPIAEGDRPLVAKEVQERCYRSNRSADPAPGGARGSVFPSRFSEVSGNGNLPQTWVAIRPAVVHSRCGAGVKLIVPPPPTVPSGDRHADVELFARPPPSRCFVGVGRAG